MNSLLEMRGIVRAFGAVRANDGIDLDVPAGRIVGLLGENGSGKSTLMKLLFGMIAPDAGAIIFKGRELSGHRPAEAMRAGLAMIHQHFMLIEAMSVADNVMLGWREAGRVPRRAEIAANIRQASARFGLDLDPDAIVATLPLGRRQRVEILKAILRGADLLILDEPTSNLAPAEVAGLLGILRRLRAEGRGIVFITHKLREVLEVCDEVVVLRAGRVAGRAPVAGVSRAALAEMMVGRDTTAPRSPRPSAPEGDGARDGERGGAAPRLVARGLRGPGLGPLDLDLRAGEILGVAGVDGNGQLELADTLAGLRRASGTLALDGRDITRAPVAERTRAGLAYLPADRARVSLVRQMSIADNLGLRDTRGFLSRPARRAERARALMAAYDVRAPGPATLVARLSGGNAQKVVIARELDRAPSVVIAHQAAWGLDPGATRFVLDRIVDLRDRGAAVLYISSELEEVMAIGDRVAVLSGGRLAGVVPRAEAELGRIGLWMAGQG